MGLQAHQARTTGYSSAPAGVLLWAWVFVWFRACWLFFILVGWFFGGFGVFWGVFKGEIKLDIAKMICKGGAYSHPTSVYSNTDRKGGGKGGVFPKSGLCSLRGELPKHPNPYPKQPPTLSAPSFGYRGSGAAPPALEPLLAQPRPWQRVRAGTERGPGRDIARQLRGNSLHKGKLIETPGLLGLLVCFHFK